MNVRVLLVEDRKVVRQGIRTLLEPEPWITVCGEVATGADVLKAVSKADPDVVIIDMNVPVVNGIASTKRLKHTYRDKKVIILSKFEDENDLVEILDAEADGYVLRNATKDEILFAIRKIADDGKYMGAEFALAILAKYKSRALNARDTKSATKITDREMEVLERIAKGMTNSQIARELITSVRTVETRRRKLLDKTGTTNTATLIRYAVLNGLIK